MRKTILLFAVAAVVVGAVGASDLKVVDREDTVIYKVNTAVERGELDPDMALAYRYLGLSLVGVESIPERYRSDYYAPEPVSGTHVWLELQGRWDSMKPEAKRVIIDAYGADPFEPAQMDGGTVYRSLNSAFGIYSNYEGFEVYTYDSQPKDGGTNFRVHWVEKGVHAIDDTSDLNNNGVPDMVENYAYDAEYAWKVYADHQWFYDPYEQIMPLRDYYPDLDYPPDEEYDYGGNDRWDMYLGRFNGNVLGMTTNDPYDFPTTYRNDRTPYFMERNHYDGPTGTYPERVTVSHELNHGVQYMYDAIESSPSATPRWYFECTAVWAQNEVFPGEDQAIGRAAGYLGHPYVSLDGTDDGGYETVAWNFFLNDRAVRYWKLPDWQPLEDKWEGAMVRNVWRALSNGDEWYTNDPSVNRESKEAAGYLTELHDLKNDYLNGRAFAETYEEFTAWNWFTGVRDDGNHYRYGARLAEVGLSNTWGTGEYPIVNFVPGESYYMNHCGAGYFLFNDPPTWNHLIIHFEGDESNEADSKDWGGAVAVTTNGTTWTDLNGNAGCMTRMFTPEDTGIVRINNPGQYDAIVAVFSCTATVGTSLPFQYSFESTSDNTAPRVAGSVAILQANPDYLELLVGSDEELYGKPEIEVWFDSTSGEDRAELVPLTASPSGQSFNGTFILDIGETGSGMMKWNAADKGGNLASGEKNFSAGFLAAGGGVIGDDDASLKLPAGTVGRATLFLVTPQGERNSGASLAATASINNGVAVETLGPAYDMSPSWARLAKPAEVTLSYDGLDVRREDYLSVYRWNGTGWEDLGGTIDRRARRVVAATDRLGKFVLGYGAKKGSTPPSGKPTVFSLHQNYPNPADTETVFAYSLPTNSHVELVVYDLSGRRVATVVDAPRGAGANNEAYALKDDSGRPLPAGVYLYRLTAGDSSATRKLVVGSR
ncbi:MAG: T9SS type A sorting domain-containing protein [Candidatus Zixiibacteriota bacterium]